jgi:hypothetical protein
LVNTAALIVTNQQKRATFWPAAFALSSMPAKRRVPSPGETRKRNCRESKGIVA